MRVPGGRAIPAILKAAKPSRREVLQQAMLVAWGTGALVAHILIGPVLHPWLSAALKWLAIAALMWGIAPMGVGAAHRIDGKIIEIMAGYWPPLANWLREDSRR